MGHNPESIIYRNIPALIYQTGLTRRAVADELGISYGTLHNKLCGITPFTWEEVKHLAHVLNYRGSLEELLKRYDDPSHDLPPWLSPNMA